MKIFSRTLIPSLLLLLAACQPSAPTLRVTQPPQPGIPSSPTPLPPTATRPPATPEPGGTDAAPTALPPSPEPSATPAVLTIAAIGDYGQQGPAEAAVADLVRSWAPDFIITLGDNNYPNGDAASIDDNVGQYYSDFIFPYSGDFGPGAAENRFFPVPGNHDWRAPDLQPYLDYFSLPGNERYYDFVRGPVHFFALDSDGSEPDGVGLSSTQAQWLQSALAASTSPWQIVYMHHPPYSSSRHGSTDYMQWPFAAWGADAVLAGHDHVYERLEIDGIPYFVNGVGGHPSRYFLFSAIEGSRFQWRSGHGAMRITAGDASILFEMISVEGQVLDKLLLNAPGPPDSVTALPDPTGFQWLPVAGGFNRPVLLTHAGDGSGRLFVVEQGGTIRILGQETLFLDIADRVNDRENEQGLLGLAFDPAFADNSFFYVNYTDRGGNTVIARYRVFPDQPGLADKDSETILLQVDQPYGNHNGGHLAFGPDGLLYAGLGDGGSAGDPQGNAQNPLSLLGKLLRIDTATGDVEVFAAGLRNPWRFNFDRLTGDLYIGDVGQNEWEEIDFLAAGSPPGANFGWNLYEGSEPYENAGSEEGLVFPVVDYNHSGGGCSVTGGYVYRGSELPAFYGVYLFGDFCAGVVWGLVRDAAGDWTAGTLFGGFESIASFGEDEAGEVYLVSLDGVVYKLARR